MYVGRIASSGLLAVMPAIAYGQIAYTPLPPVPPLRPLYPVTEPRDPPAPRYRAEMVPELPVRQLAVMPPEPTYRPVELAVVVEPRPTPVPPRLVAIAPQPPVASTVSGANSVVSPLAVKPAASLVMLRGEDVATTAAPAELAVVRAAPAPLGALLPTNTPILLHLDEDVSSKSKRVGDRFRLSVAQDVMLGSLVVIPRGAPATGEVSYRTGKGAFGKSAKMEIVIGSIDLGERKVALSGTFRQEGQGNTGAAVGAVVAAGVIAGAFVTGHSATFEAGREFRVTTREAVSIAAPEQGLAQSTQSSPRSR